MLDAALQRVQCALQLQHTELPDCLRTGPDSVLARWACTCGCRAWTRSGLRRRCRAVASWATLMRSPAAPSRVLASFRWVRSSCMCLPPLSMVVRDIIAMSVCTSTAESCLVSWLLVTCSVSCTAVARAGMGGLVSLGNDGMLCCRDCAVHQCVHHPAAACDHIPSLKKLQREEGPQVGCLCAAADPDCTIERHWCTT